MSDLMLDVRQAGELKIDCDADPSSLPSNGLWVAQHRKGGQIKWDAAQVKLWLAEGQKNGGSIKGDVLWKQSARESVLNANVLDYLLENPQLIPEDWKGKAIFFWGTIYRSRKTDRLLVRYLCWGSDRWMWRSSLLSSDFDGDQLAALRAS